MAATSWPMCYAARLQIILMYKYFASKQITVVKSIIYFKLLNFHLSTFKSLIFQVYDATNTTFARRKLIYDFVCEKYGFKLFFIESVCNDPSIIEVNIRVSIYV